MKRKNQKKRKKIKRKNQSQEAEAKIKNPIKARNQNMNIILIEVNHKTKIINNLIIQIRKMKKKLHQNQSRKPRGKITGKFIIYIQTVIHLMTNIRKRKAPNILINMKKSIIPKIKEGTTLKRNKYLIKLKDQMILRFSNQLQRSI